MDITEQTHLPERLRIICRAKSGDKAALEIFDLSEGGCMASCGDWSAVTGERVLAKLPGQDWQSADVVWVEDGLLGLAFEKLLYEPVLIHLQSQMT